MVKIGVLPAERRNEDRAIEAAIAQLCRTGFRALETRPTGIATRDEAVSSAELQ